jgi:DNA end-binding protein Ku
VEVIDRLIVLTVMRFADELVDAGQFEAPGESGLRKQEVEMAKSLVNNLAAEWDPSKYTDEYRENLMKVIQAKVKGKRVELKPEVESREANVVDLMERLRRSLEQSGGKTRAVNTAKAGKPVKRAAKSGAKKRTRHAA